MSLRDAANSTSAMTSASLRLIVNAESTSRNAQVFIELLDNALDDVQAKVSVVKAGSNATSKQARLVSAEAALQDAQVLWKSLVMEMALLKPSDRSPLMELRRSHETRLRELEEALKMERSWLARSSLTNGKIDCLPRENRDLQNERMIAATNKIQDDMQIRLNNTRNVARETTHIGQKVLEELDGQNEQINRIDEGVKEVDRETKRAKKTMKAMLRRVATDKLVMVVSFVMFTLTIVVVALVI
jgi:hypothetical protein